MESHHKIYGLRVIGQDKYFYIGCCRDLKSRLLGHLSSAAHDIGAGKAKNKIIRESGFKIEIVELENVVSEFRRVANLVEMDYIDRFLKEGHPLTNIIKPRIYTNHKITPLP